MSGRYSDWIDWKGGRCPVPKGTPVIAKYRDGHISGEVKALMMEKITSGTQYAIEWKHHGGEYDIIAYRYWIEDDKEANEVPDPGQTKYGVYKKDVSRLEFIDVYRVLERFNVTSHPIGHAIKKCLLSGQRTGNKDMLTDIKEARDALDRWIDMQAEDDHA